MVFCYDMYRPKDEADLDIFTVIELSDIATFLSRLRRKGSGMITLNGIIAIGYIHYESIMTD